MDRSQICFTRFPEKENLLYILARPVQKDTIKLSLHNHIILKCRQLIFQCPEVLARPRTDNGYGIDIVVKEEFYETGKLSNYFKFERFLENRPESVSKYIYEECCMYTITAKMAPKWNLISNYYVRGRHFLIDTAVKDCIQVNLSISDDGETSIIMNINSIKLPTMTLNKLDLPVQYFEELHLKKYTHLKPQDYRTVRVLPSLKPGKILSIHRSLSNQNVINNYPQMKRHWKNTYGYRLPENEFNIIYFQISFFDDSPVFTYPSICIRPYDPVILQRMPSTNTVTSFITDLGKYCPVVLGDSYPKPSHASKPSIAFCDANQIAVHPYTTATSAIENEPQNQVTGTQFPQNGVHNVQNRTENASSMQGDDLQQKLNTSSDDKENQKEKERIAPKFLPKTKRRMGNENEGFSAMLTPTETNKVQTQMNKSISVTELSDFNSVPISLKHKPFFINKYKNSCHPAVRPYMNMIRNKSHENSATDISSTLKHLKQTPTLTNKNNTCISALHRNAADCEDEEPVDKPTELKHLAQKPIFDIKRNAYVTATGNQEIKLLNTNPCSSNNKLETGTNEASQEQPKRTLDSSQKAPVKKPKYDAKKAAELQPINMEERIKTNSVDKLTVAQLMHWLKGHSIHCVTRDKKNDLVKKVMENFK